MEKIPKYNLNFKKLSYGIKLATSVEIKSLNLSHQGVIFDFILQKALDKKIPVSCLQLISNPMKFEYSVKQLNEMNKKYLKNVWTLDISKIGILSQEIETIQTVYGTFKKPAGLIIKGNDFLAT